MRGAKTKKRFYAGMAAVLLCVALGGCGSKASDEARGVTESVEENDHGDYTYRKEFGTYTVLDGWEESKTHSTEDKYFYIKEGHDEDAQPDNVSVNVGTNRYAQDEVMEFKDAIVAQMMAQIGGQSVEFNGTGTYTAAEDPLIIIEVVEEDGAVTRQYYVVGDHRYCLIHLTNYDDDEEAYELARIMADSFVWRD